MTKTATNKSVRLMAVFGLASLAAVGLGAAVCALSGVSAASWGRNLAAWLVGAVIAAALAAAGRRIVSPGAALAVAGLAVADHVDGRAAVRQPRLLQHAADIVLDGSDLVHGRLLTRQSPGSMEARW